MGQTESAPSNTLKHIEWMWKSNLDPWSKTEPEEWSHYSDAENLIIEEAYSSKQPTVLIDDYCIDFKHDVQISSDDPNNQRSVKRVVRNREDKHLREERFVDAPINPKRPYGGQYGWVSPFMVEVRRHLGLKPEQLPSKNSKLIPILVNKAAAGIIEEGQQIGKRREATKLAKMLLEKKNKNVKEVWQCCAYLYSLDSFLYKKLNEAMRLVGDGQKEDVWRNKVKTLEPFALLLWDDPFNTRLKTNITLYRGAQLSQEQIASYAAMAKNPKEYRSFQSYSSCSRNREKAENFGNALFIMEVVFAFITDLSPFSEYPGEEEELVTPGVCFSVQRLEFDKKTKKHLIRLKLRQRFSSKYSEHPSTCVPHREEGYSRSKSSITVQKHQ
jgi:NAD:arginine ADP-ribosyltransferase/WWE domain